MASCLTIVTWKWQQPGYRRTFTANHVNILYRMVSRNLAQPHRFICVTDDPVGLDCGIETQTLPTNFSGIPNASRREGPSCYRRLIMFSPEAQQRFGERFVSMDLDTVVIGPLDPFIDRNEDLVIWGDTSPKTPYNGSLLLLRAGSRTKVWTEFDPETSPLAGIKRGYFGSDQAWIAACLGPGEARWTRGDGVYSFRNELQRTRRLPANAKIVFFHGKFDPWAPDVQRMNPWITEYYH